MPSVLAHAEVGPAAALLPVDEAGLEKHLEVVADGRLAQAERFGEVADARLAVGCAWIRLSSRSRAGSAIDFKRRRAGRLRLVERPLQERRAGSGDRVAIGSARAHIRRNPY